jgi:hypothetical protein
MGKQVMGLPLPSLLKNANHREVTVSALGTLNLRLPLARCATTTLTSEVLTLLVRKPGNDEKADQIDAAVTHQPRETRAAHIPRISVPKHPPLLPLNMHAAKQTILRLKVLWKRLRRNLHRFMFHIRSPTHQGI